MTQRMGETEFRRLVDEAKERHNISDVVARDRKVRKAGRDMVALCAFHSERTPSMHLNDAKGTYYCFGCGASGDIVKYVRETQGIGFMDAMRWLGAADLPQVDPAARAQAAVEDAAERAAAIDEARAVWIRSLPAAGTVAEAYARFRGIHMPLPDSIRYVMTYSWRDAETGETSSDYPAMVGKVVDGDGRFVGIQRIFLRDDGKAKRFGKKSKLSLGRIKGGALRLGPPTSEIILVEGPEDGLSLAQELRGGSVWVTAGTAMMPSVITPPTVRTVVLAGDNDAAGKLAVKAAAAAIAERGIAVRTMFPDPRFKDWNDQLRGITI